MHLLFYVILQLVEAIFELKALQPAVLNVTILIPVLCHQILGSAQEHE